jgi:hypothetical protein
VERKEVIRYERDRQTGNRSRQTSIGHDDIILGLLEKERKIDKR